MLHYSQRDKLAATRQFLRVGGHSTRADKQDLTIRGALALSYLFTSCAASRCMHVRMLHVVQQTSLALHFLEITVRGVWERKKARAALTAAVWLFHCELHSLMI